MHSQSISTLRSSEPARTSEVSVTLCLGSGPYQEGLAEALQAREMLVRAVRLWPTIEVLEPRDRSLVQVKKFHGMAFLNRCMWAAWVRLPATRRSRLPGLVTIWLNDRVISKRVGPAK